MPQYSMVLIASIRCGPRIMPNAYCAALMRADASCAVAVSTTKRDRTIAAKIPLLEKEGWREAPGWSARLKPFAELTTPSAPRFTRRIHPSFSRRGKNHRINISEPQPQACLHAAHRVERGRQPELSAADDGVQRFD